MTYFAMLSLAPLLMMAIAIAGFVFGDQMAEQEIIERVAQVTDAELAETVGSLIKNAARPESGLIAGSISIAILIFAASGVFSQLHHTFNDIWHVPIEEQTGWWFLLRTRFIGILLVLSAGLILIATMLFSSGLEAFGSWLGEYAPRSVGWFHLTDKALAFVVTPLVLSLIYWLLPATNVEWRDVWLAALLTAVFMYGSRYLIGLYLRFSTTEQVYGAAGSLVVLLIWIYINGLVVFYGAAFSHAWSLEFGSRSGCDTSFLQAHEKAKEQTDESTEENVNEPMEGPSAKDS